jgi:hypothetical protein
VKIRIFALALFVAASVAVPASSQEAVATPAAQGAARDYLSFLPSDTREKLFASGEIDDSAAKPADLEFWQKSPFASFVRESFAGKPSSIAAEALFILDRPAGMNAEDTDARVLKSFTEFSSMKGLLVYSASLRKMETFIFDSYRVASLSDTARLPDPVFPSIPRHYECTMYQKEEQTGGVYSRLAFDAHDGWYSVSLNNLTGMKYLFFQLVAPKDLTTLFIIVPTADRVILYGITVANTPRFMGLERSKSSSFSNRMKALSGWFSGNLAK